MTDVGDVLMQVWLFYWASAAFCGAFFGVLEALVMCGIVKKAIEVWKGKGYYGISIFNTVRFTKLYTTKQMYQHMGRTTQAIRARRIKDRYTLVG